MPVVPATFFDSAIWHYLALSRIIWDYLGLYGTISDYLELYQTRVQVEAGESNFLLFETFSLFHFYFIFFTQASCKGARAPKKDDSVKEAPAYCLNFLEGLHK